MDMVFNEEVRFKDWFNRFEKRRKGKLELIQNYRTEKILEILDQVKDEWRKKKYRERALKTMPKVTGFSMDEVEEGIDLLQEILSKQNIEKRIEKELGGNYLDSWIEKDGVGIFAPPIGVLLHVFAGNIFINGIESLVNGIITKNLNIIKTSSSDRFFPYLFLESIAECSQDLASTISIISFKGGDRKTEKKLKEIVDGIIVWGSDEAVLGYRKGLPLGKRIIEHGPKCGIGVIEDYNKELAGEVAKDVVSWGQRSCASPQVLYIKRGLNTKKIMKDIGKAMDKHPDQEMQADQAVEILKAREIARMGKVFGDYDYFFSPEPNRWQIILTKKFELSPLGRTLYVREYENIDEIINEIPRAYMQTIAISSGRRREIGKMFVLAGASRIVRFGKMTSATLGAPHDGNYPLGELVRFCGMEE